MDSVIIDKAEEGFLEALELIRGEKIGWRCHHIQLASQGIHATEAQLKELGAIILPLINDRHMSLFLYHDSDIMVLFKPEEKDILLRLISEIFTFLIPHYKADAAKEAEYCTDYSVFDDHQAIASMVAEKLAKKKEAHYIGTTTGEKITKAQVTANLMTRKVRDQTVFLTLTADTALLELLQNCITEHAVMKEGKGAHYSADSLLEGIRQYFTHAPDMVFLDDALEEKGVLKWLKYMTDFDTDGYILLLSKNTDADYAKTLESYGSKATIMKPFTPDIISGYVSDFLRTKRAE